MDREGAQRLLRVVAERDGTRSLNLTTNLACSKWGGIFTGDPRPSAMIDRLAHHGRLRPTVIGDWIVVWRLPWSGWGPWVACDVCNADRSRHRWMWVACYLSRAA